jgi:hypothetical protein
MKIMPGEYDIGANTLILPDYVDMEGSGEKTTRIKGNINALAGVVAVVTDNTEIRFLTVEHTGGGAYAHAITIDGSSPKITNVTAVASGGVETIGFNVNFASPELTNVTAEVSSCTECVAVYSFSSSTKMTNVKATASGGIIVNAGVYNNGSSQTMTNVRASASAGAENWGVHNDSSSPEMINVTAIASGGTRNYAVDNWAASPKMTNVTATASGASTDNYGVRSRFSSTTEINHSVIKGATYSIYTDPSSSTLIGNTKLDGTVSGTPYTTCAGVYNTGYTFYASTCP